jgi:putative phage-type endonuclease
MKYRLAPANYKEWLEDRKNNPSIGASMSPAILGFNPWQSAVDVWDKLVNNTEDITDNLTMYLGREMEPIVKKLFMDQTGLKVLNDNKIRIDDKHEFLTTNLDGMVVGEGIPVEYKTTAKPWDGDIPNHYFVQLQHQMMVTESPSIYFCSLSMGFKKQLIVERYDRNDEFIGELRDELVAFWNDHVLTGKPPEPKSIADARKVFNNADPESVATIDDYMVVTELRALRETRAELDRQINEKQLEIMKIIGDKETLVSTAGYELVTWKKSKPTTYLNSKKLADENPDVYLKYLKQRDGSRRFVLKKTEE